MPNTPALVGTGAAAFSRGSSATADDSALAKKILGAVGTADEVSEKLLDAVTGLSGSGPAYIYTVIEAMADGGVLMGLPRATALTLYLEALLVTELKPKSGFYDFDAKYTDGMTDHICPAEIPDEITRACKDIALRAHQLLGCRGATRSDFRWDDERGLDGLYLLEINTQPGMTPLSLVPEQAKHMGMSYEDLVEAMVSEALEFAEAQKVKA